MKKEGQDLDRVKDLIPVAIKLGFDFATAVEKRDCSTALEILEQIELHTIGTINKIFNKSLTSFLDIFCQLLVQDPLVCTIKPVQVSEFFMRGYGDNIL